MSRLFLTRGFHKISATLSIMHGFATFFTADWFLFMDVYQQEMIRTSFGLLVREERLRSAFSDYSFLVFPAAKAYEGFLKKYFYAQGLIPLEVFESKNFRIGRVLNPDIYPDRRDEHWLYDTLVSRCGREMAAQVWHVWLMHRNQVFHDFPRTRHHLTVTEAKNAVYELAQTMASLMRCRWQAPES